MRVLDLDLDFFLSGVSRREDGRADPEKLIPWVPERVHRFLDESCW